MSSGRVLSLHVSPTSAASPLQGAGTWVHLALTEAVIGRPQMLPSADSWACQLNILLICHVLSPVGNLLS